MATDGEKEKVRNPLEIAVVLEQVLNYVPPEDLMNARVVAKLWRDESLDNFRNSIVYVLDPDTESDRFLRLSLNIEANGGGSETMSGDNASSIPPSSASGMYKFQDKPNKKFRMAGPNRITPDGFEIWGIGPMPYFWNQCGPNLTYLDLQRATYLFKSSFVEALISFFKLCPNLEELRFCPIWVNDSELRISETQLAIKQENLALKMKSLSIELIGIDLFMAEYGCVHYQYHMEYPEVWRYLFKLIPNLKKLSLDGGEQYHIVLEALLQKTLTTNQLIQLDSFEYNGEKFERWRTINWVLTSLWTYLKNCEVDASCRPFKELKLMKIPFDSVFNFPKTFRSILLDIRTRIESLCVELRFSRDYDPEPPEHFDFFNLIFPNLVDLALEFDYKPFPVDECNAQENFLFFDFSVLHGTPNLKRFKMKTLHVPDRAWLKRWLTVEDLMNAPGQKWHLIDRTEKVTEDELVWEEDEYWRGPIEGDGTEVFDPEKERNEIVLEKMKKFYFTGRFTTEALLVLGKWMKNLKEFAAIFDDETISIPFVIWPGTLKKLTVLQTSFEGEDQISGKLISDLREMYPEVEIVLEGQIDIPMDRLALGNESE